MERVHGWFIGWAGWLLIGCLVGWLLDGMWMVSWLVGWLFGLVG